MTLLDTIGINQLKLLLLCEKIYLLNLFYTKLITIISSIVKPNQSHI